MDLAALESKVKNMPPKACTSLFILCVAVIMFCSAAEAKPSIDFSFVKNNGYGIGNNIGGLWTVNAEVSSDVRRVEFYLDDQLKYNDTDAPFSWQFQTDNYSLGSHAIKAVAYDSNGDTAFLQVERNFQEASTETITLMIFAVTIAVVAVAATAVFALYRMKAKKK